MSEIKPALTPEEWADEVRWGACGDAISDAVDEWYPPNPDEPVRAMDESLERAAAIALRHGPHPLTWVDVDRLRQVADEYGPNRRDHLNDIAARIASLLPPR